jgi:hypothetical protein
MLWNSFLKWAIGLTLYNLEKRTKVYQKSWKRNTALPQSRGSERPLQYTASREVPACSCVLTPVSELVCSQKEYSRPGVIHPTFSKDSDRHWKSKQIKVTFLKYLQAHVITSLIYPFGEVTFSWMTHTTAATLYTMALWF